ncbi:MAG: amino acid ABC transporter substrate-binding protein [Deltaproteobacteria bacterium]|nr:amino acid ABC transporter substrate-binding protein [Deltaproteobacteria bacterium]
MKIVTCLLLMLVLMCNSAYAAEKKPFHWVDDADYPPLIYRGTNGKPKGIFYEIMTEAFHRLDIPLKVEVYPWARAQKIVTDGKADGMITVLTDSRKKIFLGSDPILLVSEHIFVNKNNHRIKEIMAIRSLKAILPFKVVETIGSGWTDEELNGAHIIWVPRMDNAFNMLIKNRADIFIANGFTGAAFIKKKTREGSSYSEGYKNIITNPYPLRTIAFRLLIRKDSSFTNIIDRFNETIHRMQMDKTIQHILEGGRQLPLDGAQNQR